MSPGPLLRPPCCGAAAAGWGVAEGCAGLEQLQNPPGGLRHGAGPDLSPLRLPPAALWPGLPPRAPRRRSPVSIPLPGPPRSCQAATGGQRPPRSVPTRLPARQSQAASTFGPGLPAINRKPLGGAGAGLRRGLALPPPSRAAEPRGRTARPGPRRRRPLTGRSRVGAQRRQQQQQHAPSRRPARN